jgi:hypothetical protein
MIKQGVAAIEINVEWNSYAQSSRLQIKFTAGVCSRRACVMKSNHVLWRLKEEPLQNDVCRFVSNSSNDKQENRHVVHTYLLDKERAIPIFSCQID